MFNVASPLEGIVFGAAVGLWRQVVEWCISTQSTSVRFGGVALRGLGDGCGVMDSHKVGALSGAMVASTASLTRSLHLITPKDGSVEDGGGGVSACALARVVGLLDRFVPAASHWAA